jgi:hypothetical protein
MHEAKESRYQRREATTWTESTLPSSKANDFSEDSTSDKEKTVSQVEADFEDPTRLHLKYGPLLW